jgi:hypothetical protein
LMRQIEDNEVIEHIKRVGVVFYERAVEAGEEVLVSRPV